VGSFRRYLDALYGCHGTVVMGVLNVTPDSFFDGGRFMGDAGLRRVDELIAEGAHIVDIGGESTRPGAAAVSADEQIRRIAPILPYVLRHRGVLVTVDTTDAKVAEFALESGAHAINDVSCLANPRLATVVAAHSAGLVLMHSRGEMSKMPGFSQIPENAYVDVVADIKLEWARSRDTAKSLGVDPDDIAFDPGIGFWKSAQQSLAIVQRIGEFSALGAPIVVGPSRKSFLNVLGEVSPEHRLGGSIAACLHAAEYGVCAVRVHDVLITRQALDLMRVLRRNKGEPSEQRGVGMVGAC